MHRNNLNTFFFVDGSNRVDVNLLMVAFNESLTWESGDVNSDAIKVLPVNFQTEHKQKLSRLYRSLLRSY